MARHRSEAPSAPRHAPISPVDPFGDPVDLPRGGVAAPPAPGLPDLPPVDAGPPSWPLDPAPLPDGPPSQRPLDPASRAIGADRAPGSVPAPWTGPTPRPVPPPRSGPDAPARSPAVPEPRTGGRHAWAVEPDVAVPVAPPTVRREAAPRARVAPPAPAAIRPGDESGPVPRSPERRPQAHPASRRVAGGHDPETNPLDLAAIALAGARTATGSHRIGGTGGLPSLTGTAGPLAIPGAPATGGHRIATGARGLSPTRTAGALAVAGALVSAGVAVLSSGSMLASAEPGPAADTPAAAEQYDAGGR